MKRLILIAMLIPSTAFASGSTLAQIFTNQTTSKTSASYDVSGWKTKTLFVFGKYSGGVFHNLSGAVAVKCGPTKTGPFTINCNQSQLASTPAVTTTTNSVISWQDAVQFIQITWTRTIRAVNVWLSGNSN